MKKLIVSVLVSVLLVSAPIYAASIDYSSLSEDELVSVIDGARNELISRDCVIKNDTVFLENDLCQVYVDEGKEIEYKNDFLHIPVICVNNTKSEISFQLDHVKVNGWDVSGLIGNLSGESKKMTDISIHLKDTDITSFEEIKDVTMALIGFNMETLKRDAEGEELTYVLNQ